MRNISYTTQFGNLYLKYSKSIRHRLGKIQDYIDLSQSDCKNSSVMSTHKKCFTQQESIKFISILAKSYITDVYTLIRYKKTKREKIIEQQVIPQKLKPQACGLLSKFRDKHSSAEPMNLIPVLDITSMSKNQADVSLSNCCELTLDMSNSILKNMTAGQQIVLLIIKDEKKHCQINDEIEKRAEEFIASPHALQEFLDNNIHPKLHFNDYYRLAEQSKKLIDNVPALGEFLHKNISPHLDPKEYQKIYAEVEKKELEFKHNPNKLQDFLDIIINAELDDIQIRQYSHIRAKENQSINKTKDTARLFIRNTGCGSLIVARQPKFLIVSAPWSNHYTCPKAEYPLFFVSVGSGVAPALSMILERKEDAKKRNVKIAKNIIMIGYKDIHSDYALDELKALTADTNNNLEIMIAYGDNQEIPHILHKLDVHTNLKCLLDNKDNLIKVNDILNMEDIHIRFSGYLELKAQLQKTFTSKNKRFSRPYAYTANYFVNHRLKSLEKQGRIEAEGTYAKQKNLQAE